MISTLGLIYSFLLFSGFVSIHDFSNTLLIFLAVFHLCISSVLVLFLVASVRSTQVGFLPVQLCRNLIREVRGLMSDGVRELKSLFRDIKDLTFMTLGMRLDCFERVL